MNQSTFNRLARPQLEGPLEQRLARGFSSGPGAFSDSLPDSCFQSFGSLFSHLSMLARLRAHFLLSGIPKCLLIPHSWCASFIHSFISSTTCAVAPLVSSPPQIFTKCLPSTMHSAGSEHRRAQIARLRRVQASRQENFLCPTVTKSVTERL